MDLSSNIMLATFTSNPIPITQKGDEPKALSDCVRALGVTRRLLRARQWGRV